jgi:3-oxoacyl-[acyl-carrier protein] reductase
LNRADPARVLDEKVAVVTGAARGIGRAVAELLGEHGCSVVVADLDRTLADECAEELPTNAIAFGGDITDPDTPRSLITETVRAFGRVDILVNNAGYPFDAMVHKMTDAQFRAMLDIHVTAPFRMIRAAAPYLLRPASELRESDAGIRKIVNVASIAGQMGAVGTANYSAGKAAVVGLTKSVAKEWGRAGVACNAVCFGPIDTRLSAVQGDENTTEVAGETIRLGVPAAQREAIAEVVPLGRHGSPHEAAGAVFFLASPWSDYVTGQVLNVTGGFAGGMQS